MFLYKSSHIIFFIVTAALMFEEPLIFLSKLDSSVYSATKFIALPLILVDMLFHLNYYLRPNYGWLFALALLIGVGGGFIMGNVPFERFWELLPIGFILLYYMKPRSEEDILVMLRICFFSALLVPVIMILAFLGFVPALQITATEEVFRMTAGVSNSTFGLYTVFIFSTIGGILLGKESSRLGLSRVLLSVSFIILGCVGILLTAQRSALLASAICVSIAISMKIRQFHVSKITIFTSIVLMMAFVYLTFDQIAILADTLLYRFQGMVDDQNVIIRQGFYKIFISSILNNISIVGPGMDIVRDQSGGVESHFLLGEAYFDGGMVFLLVVISGFLSAGVGLWKRYINQHDSTKININVVLISLLSGMFVYLSFYPGLRTRIVYMVIGICISYGKNPRYLCKKSERVKLLDPVTT